MNNPNNKSRYTKPTITIYGKLKNITTGGSQLAGENDRFTRH